MLAGRKVSSTFCVSVVLVDLILFYYHAENLLQIPTREPFLLGIPSYLYIMVLVVALVASGICTYRNKIELVHSGICLIVCASSSDWWLISS